MPRRPAFPRICVALGFDDVHDLLRHARAEADAGAGFLEFRLDYLRQPPDGVAAVRKFLDEYPGCMVLATCRRRENQGRFRGDIGEQIRLLEKAAKAGARAVDVEIESVAGGKLEALRASADLIISYHNFTGTPALEAVLRRLMRFPAAAYKIVTTAGKPSDVCRLVSLAKTHPRVPLIVLSMGEVGFPSRVIAPVYGALYTYAAPAEAEGTAPGQISAHQLRQLYRVEHLTRSTKIYGVIADPVGHSISPAVHNRAFHRRHLDAVYVPFLVRTQHLKDFFAAADRLPVAGFSVTIPHKQKALRYLDVVDPLARRIGAVNTVWKKAGKWRGANTDVDGITIPLGRHLRLCNSAVLVAGNGGGARAAAFALADQGARVTIVGRNPERVRALAKACGAEAITCEQLNGRHFDAVVHATSLGMHPDVDGCFFKDRIPADIVFEMVYNPLETVLLRRAREQRKLAIDGLQMFIEQAVRQFEIWTGAAAPRPAMERAAWDALACRLPIIEK